jgi:hypothetical protein
MDVKNAFLNKILEEDIYMVQPKSYKNNSHNNLVYKLTKAIYALKQAQQV